MHQHLCVCACVWSCPGFLCHLTVFWKDRRLGEGVHSRTDGKTDLGCSPEIAYGSWLVAVWTPKLDAFGSVVWMVWMAEKQQMKTIHNKPDWSRKKHQTMPWKGISSIRIQYTRSYINDYRGFSFCSCAALENGWIEWLKDNRIKYRGTGKHKI